MAILEKNQSTNALGFCGLLSAAGLIVEALLWTASGWTPASFTSSASALSYLRSGGHVLMAAVAAGFVNLAFLVILNVGIASTLQRERPYLAAAFLWFGMIGVTLHLLVPLSHWYGVNAFNAWSSANNPDVSGAWMGFYLVGHEAAGGGGKLFMGLSMVAAGLATINDKPTRLLGLVGIMAGIASALTLLSPVKPVSGIAYALFMPSLALSVIYEIFDHNKAAFHDRFRHHAERIMARHHFDIIASWETRHGDRTEFVYLLQWPDQSTMKQRWDAFMADEEWSQIKRMTGAQHGTLVGEIQDRLLSKTSYSSC